MWEQQLQEIRAGNLKTLARCISLVENEAPDYEELLMKLPPSTIPVVGITGPPGAGKSTLTDALIGEFVSKQKKVCVICVDPSSPFNMGALLGDRIRMSEWYDHPGVFIRSLASRGALGGLHPAIIPITDLVRSAPFDMVLVETVGVGQSEVEIAGLADITVVVLVPESGDEVQTMKAGLMEIADIFVVNKSDRPDADLFVKNLRSMLSPALMQNHNIPVIKTIATEKKGTTELYNILVEQSAHPVNNEKHHFLLAEKAFILVQQKRMAGINKLELAKEIKQLKQEGAFNLYRFIKKYTG